jgi:hypothetical protein
MSSGHFPNIVAFAEDVCRPLIAVAANLVMKNGIFKPASSLRALLTGLPFYSR